MHGAAQRRADEDPQHSWQVPKLCGEHGTHQRPGSGDGRKVVAEHDPAIGLNIILPVLMHNGWGGSLLINRQHLRH